MAIVSARSFEHGAQRCARTSSCGPRTALSHARVDSAMAVWREALADRVLELADEVALADRPPLLPGRHISGAQDVCHAELFRRCRFVVHHGGAGTVATAAACVFACGADTNSSR